MLDVDNWFLQIAILMAIVFAFAFFLIDGWKTAAKTMKFLFGALFFLMLFLIGLSLNMEKITNRKYELQFVGKFVLDKSYSWIDSTNVDISDSIFLTFTKNKEYTLNVNSLGIMGEHGKWYLEIHGLRKKLFLQPDKNFGWTIFNIDFKPNMIFIESEKRGNNYEVLTFKCRLTAK